MNHCLVKNCRYKYSHTTKGHRCSKCLSYGHGFIECGNQELMNELKKHHSDIMNKEEQCTAKTCNFRTTHSIEAHFCFKCNGRHSWNTCEFYSVMPQASTDYARNIMGDIEGPVYVKSWIGMGTWQYAKRDDCGKLVSTYSVDYQYDNDQNVLNFIKGYKLVENIKK